MPDAIIFTFGWIGAVAAAGMLGAVAARGRIGWAWWSARCC